VSVDSEVANVEVRVEESTTLIEAVPVEESNRLIEPSLVAVELQSEPSLVAVELQSEPESGPQES
jgi:hypothetical protein